MLTLFRLMKKQDKQVIAKSFGSNEHVFESWLTNLNYVRNICAHHGRLWNRQLAVNPLIPAKDLRWHEAAYPISSNRIYSTLCILKSLLDVIVPQSNWKARFYSILAEFPMIHRISMAIPEDFEKSAIWRWDIRNLLPASRGFLYLFSILRRFTENERGKRPRLYGIKRFICSGNGALRSPVSPAPPGKPSGQPA